MIYLELVLRYYVFMLRPYFVPINVYEQKHVAFEFKLPHFRFMTVLTSKSIWFVINERRPIVQTSHHQSRYGLIKVFIKAFQIKILKWW